MSVNSSDYVIIGAGSAGSVLANRLSTHNSVTVLEAGPDDYALDFRLHMPAALSHVLSDNRYNWYYHSEPEAGLNNRKLYCPRGRVLGGSSSINGMIYIRGNAADFDGWAMNPGLEDWRYGESAYHPCCTCKMGIDEMSVVDSQAIVHGTEGLRIVDASIMPEITNGNLNAPVIMMAEKLSDTILGREPPN